MLRCCWAVDWLPENSSKFSLNRCCGVGVAGLEVATVGNSFSRDSLMGVASERGLSLSALRASSSSGKSSPRSSSVMVAIDSHGDGEQTGNMKRPLRRCFGNYSIFSSHRDGLDLLEDSGVIAKYKITERLVNMTS